MNPRPARSEALPVHPVDSDQGARCGKIRWPCYAGQMVGPLDRIETATAEPVMSIREADPAPHWEPIQRSNLSEEIADRLIKQILEGRYDFGARLPPERDIARLLGVGRPSVREAIRILSVLGLIEVRPGEGTFVVDKHAAFVAKAFSWTALLDPRTIQDVVETRTAIESELAGLTASRAGEETLSALAGFVDEMRASSGDVERFSAADLNFHLTIAEAAGNTTLSRLLFATQSLLREWIQRALSKQTTYGRAIDQHAVILKAIRDRDVLRARHETRIHVEEMGELLMETARTFDGGVGSLDAHRPSEAP
jgi:GntR family transcriptional repressor for pyruvate dehydrogenase complex